MTLNPVDKWHGTDEKEKEAESQKQREREQSFGLVVLMVINGKEWTSVWSNSIGIFRVLCL